MAQQVQISGNIVTLRPSRIASYQFDKSRRPLGSGSMGTVYKGVDQRGNPVAIKWVKDRYAANPLVRERARQEADMKFSHPNLVDMLGYCEAGATGPIFIISRYVNGENMDKFIDTHVRSLPSPEKRICQLFMPVLDALTYIHSHNILHMDIKPSNIMVENQHNVRLMDLGIAFVEVSNDKTMGSSSSGMLGTPRFAAPEQFAAGPQRIDYSPATDIYEAGVTLYELITRQHPFAAQSVAEAKQLHLTKVLPMTSSISRPVYEVLLKATAIQATARYQTAAQMKQALVAALNYKPTFLDRIKDKIFKK